MGDDAQPPPEVLPYQTPGQEPPAGHAPHAPGMARWAVAVAVIASPILTWPVAGGIDWIGWHVYGMGAAEKSRLTFPIIWLLPVGSFILTTIARLANPPSPGGALDSPGRRLTWVAIGFNVCTAVLYALFFGFVCLTVAPWAGRD